MSSASAIASEYAHRHTPNPCKDCPRRAVHCRHDCSDWQDYLRRFTQTRRMIEQNFNKEHAAQEFLLANAARENAKKRRRRKGG